MGDEGAQAGGGNQRNHRGGNQHRSGGKRGGHGGKGQNNGPWKDNRPTKRRRVYGERSAEKDGEGGETHDRRGDRDDRPPPRPSNMSIHFSAEDIAAEERRPKRKVAVLIGYAGTGYSGMQINHDEKTIEGDLFGAFVAAGAIAKTNADDPKKSSLVRCARTDKGVHAAGNVISLKLIVEDADIVDKINAALPPQIRVWGIQRTINSFSCYQACDSRWYEYLIPSYALLPPHPKSYLGHEMVASSKKAGEGVYEAMMERLSDVKDFWDVVERDTVTPVLEKLTPEVRRSVEEQLHTGEFASGGVRSLDDLEKPVEKTAEGEAKPEEKEEEKKDVEMTTETEPSAEPAKAAETAETTEAEAPKEAESEPKEQQAPSHKMAVEQAMREIKAAYITAKRQYRITPSRLDALQDALTQYVGTRNFHNYTIQKSYNDASAKRHIKSFLVNKEPIQIRDTQWLSLKVHGQSFMMHQIRKMVAMAVLVARCGTDPEPAMALSYERRRISIPRAPGFGLLLERPVFDTYNSRAQANGKDPLDFDVYEKEMRAFKDAEIYKRIWNVEEEQNVFHAYFHQIDNFRSSYFLWAVPGGYDAAFERFGSIGGAQDNGPKVPEGLEDPDEDNENPNEGEG